MAQASPKVLVPLAQGCEEIEAVTIIDILVRGQVDVVTVSLDNQKTITASRGVQLVAQKTLAEVQHEPFAMIVIPGGLAGAKRLQNDTRLLAMLTTTVAQGRYAAAVCAGPKVLQAAALLEHKQATGYPGIVDQIPNSTLHYVDTPVIQDGQIITSRGPASVMQFALELVKILKGDTIYLQVKNAL